MFETFMEFSFKPQFSFLDGFILSICSLFFVLSEPNLGYIAIGGVWIGISSVIKYKLNLLK